MAKKEALQVEAARRGEEYLATCRGCAPAVFAAVMDTLGHGDDAAAREVCKASVGLTGGTGFMSVGTCGAVAGGAMAVSYSFGYGREDLEEDVARTLAVNTAVAQLGKRVVERYGHIQCQEIQFSHWGKSFRFTHPEAFAEFLAFCVDERSGLKCQTLTGVVSGWAVECILEHNPAFCRREK